MMLQLQGACYCADAQQCVLAPVGVVIDGAFRVCTIAAAQQRVCVCVCHCDAVQGLANMLRLKHIVMQFRG